MLAYHSLLVINDITSIQTLELNLIWGLAVARAAVARAAVARAYLHAAFKR